MSPSKLSLIASNIYLPSISKYVGFNGDGSICNSLRLVTAPFFIPPFNTPLFMKAKSQL